MSRGFLTGTVLKRIDASTLSVLVTRRVHHPIFGKVIKRFKKYLVHDPYQKSQVNDVVDIISSRPMSKRKKFILHIKD